MKKKKKRLPTHTYQEKIKHRMAMERVGLCGNTRPLGPLAQQMQPPTAFRVICATNKVNAEINANATAGLNG